MKQTPLLESDPQARRAFDYYPTPAWMTRALLKRFRISDVVEPCAGDGAIANVLANDGIEVLTNDLDPSRRTNWHLDATTPKAWDTFMSRKPYWGVTNVPYNLADQIVPLAVERLRYFATILRLSWLEPTEKRAAFLKAHPPKFLIVMPRHDFKGAGQTDSVTSAWFVWGVPDIYGRAIEIVTKDERDELMALR